MALSKNKMGQRNLCLNNCKYYLSKTIFVKRIKMSSFYIKILKMFGADKFKADITPYHSPEPYYG